MPHFNRNTKTTGTFQGRHLRIGQRTYKLLFLCCLLLLSTGFSLFEKPQTKSSPEYINNASSNPLSCNEKHAVKADIVALEQAYLLNRFAAFVPGGMLYALSSDVEYVDPETNLHEMLSSAKLEDPKFAQKVAGHVKLKSTKRPRPLVLRVNEGDCLDVTFTNLLPPEWSEEGGIPEEYKGKLPEHVETTAGAPTSRKLVTAEKVSKDIPRTRAASFHVNGLEYVPIKPDECPKDVVCGGDGSNVGLSANQGLVFNPSTEQFDKDTNQKKFALGSLVLPGQRAMLRMKGGKEGTYFAHSMGALVGGEGDGGQVGLGLFGAVNVEPAGSKWYRSQVTHEDLQAVTGTPDQNHPYTKIAYEKVTNGMPILAILDAKNNIVHSDLNAIVVQKEPEPGSEAEKTHLADCKKRVFGDSCRLSFREFTVIMHDEVHAEQAFAELDDESNPLHYLKDGMGINYGVSSMGSLVMGSQAQRSVGVVAKCPECRAEEFFLSSWANGDPALILKWDETGEKPIGAMYPDDPSNVHHSYLGDPVRYRNLHAGPKETHVFHLHAHQWVMDDGEPNSTYLDSQTISPGATFSYGIEFGGSGNRNYTPGDSIFHCHLYPHFAQGMWELWRTHDVFEDGTPGLFNAQLPVSNTNNPRWRNLPDAEVKEGIQTPALIPIPNMALAPMPTAKFAGYPFYIAGEPGHRPPQPPLDMDVNDPTYQASIDKEPDAAKIVNGGLPRHIVTGIDSTLKKGDPVIEDALEKGGDAAQLIARRVYEQNKGSVSTLAGEWSDIHIKTLQHSGEPSEKLAMEFHEGKLKTKELDPIDHPIPSPKHPDWFLGYKAYKTAWADGIKDWQKPHGEKEVDPPLFYVNGRPRASGAPFANPCPENTPERKYRAAFIQTELTVNRHGWFDPQGRIVILENDIKDIIDPNTRSRLPEPLFFRANSGECIDFKSSNFMPSALNVDDFQVYTPTDTIGQHIHLVKFDVTSSDGSGNGWNYEDGTFSPDEVRERIFAHWHTTGDKSWKPKAHPLFLPGGDIYEHRSEARYSKLYEKGICPAQDNGESDERYKHRLDEEHPFCGAQRTTQRWWADPILVEQRDQYGKLNGKLKDNTLRTVFTHDHFGPSSHQQHGLYAGLVIEPANSTWEKMDAKNEQASEALKKAKVCNDKRSANPQGSAKIGECDDAIAFGLLGGSDLHKKPHIDFLNEKHPLAPINPRQPLRLREDGGPTATMAKIIAPNCIGDANSHPSQPDEGKTPLASVNCQDDKALQAGQTRREFALAIADFAGVYNTALEPINPETRDESARRFGQRQVALQIPRPLAISSEDPGTQLFNYRNEPLALRIAHIKGNAQLGGFDYSQESESDSSKCKSGSLICTGDMANGFASEPHKQRDLELATKSYAKWIKWTGSESDLVGSGTRSFLENKGLMPVLKKP